jgi:hypothetical protein
MIETQLPKHISSTSTSNAMDTTRECVIMNKPRFGYASMQIAPVITLPTQFAKSTLPYLESTGLELLPTETHATVEKRVENSRDPRTKNPYFTGREPFMLRPTLSIVMTKTSRWD